jgi:hypothetical protein
MNRWLNFLFVLLGSLPVWGFLYFAYRFRGCRNFSRYCLVRGLLFAVGYALLALAYFHAETSTLYWFLFAFFAAVYLSGLLLRNMLKRAAADPDEAKKYKSVLKDMTGIDDE